MKLCPGSWDRTEPGMPWSNHASDFKVGTEPCMPWSNPAKLKLNPVCPGRIMPVIFKVGTEPGMPWWNHTGDFKVVN